MSFAFFYRAAEYPFGWSVLGDCGAYLLLNVQTMCQMMELMAVHRRFVTSVTVVIRFTTEFTKDSAATSPPAEVPFSTTPRVPSCGSPGVGPRDVPRARGAPVDAHQQIASITANVMYWGSLAGKSFSTRHPFTDAASDSDAKLMSEMLGVDPVLKATSPVLAVIFTLIL